MFDQFSKCFQAAHTDKLWDLETVETYAGKQTRHNWYWSKRKGPVCVCVELTSAHRTPWAVTRADFHYGMKRGRSEDGWERKRAMRWGNMMERQNRKKGRTEEKRRQKDGQTDMERHKTERTDKRMEPNERRRSVGPPDEREGKAPLLLPFLLFFLLWGCCVSFLHSQIYSAFI